MRPAITTAPSIGIVHHHEIGEREPTRPQIKTIYRNAIPLIDLLPEPARPTIFIHVLLLTQ
jgi:hypothetical protein